MSTEADARILIDKLLEAAGWTITNKAQVSTEEASSDGRADYLLKTFDLQAVVVLPKGMFEPYTPNPTCFMIFKNTGRPTKDVWFFNVEGDGSSLKKARKFGPQYRNDFPDLLRMWPNRETEERRAWLVPAKKIIDKGYNMTLSGLDLIKPETVDYPEPEEILASVATKEERILELIQEMRELLEGESGK